MARHEHEEMDEHEWSGRDEGGMPERSALAQVAEQIAPEQRLFGEAGLREQPRQKSRPTGVHLERRQRQHPIGRDDKHEQRGTPNAASMPRSTGMPKPRRRTATAGRGPEQQAFGRHRCRDHDRPDEHSGLSAVASDRRGDPLEQREDSGTPTSSRMNHLRSRMNPRRTASKAVPYTRSIDGVVDRVEAVRELALPESHPGRAPSPPPTRSWACRRSLRRDRTIACRSHTESSPSRPRLRALSRQCPAQPIQQLEPWRLVKDPEPAESDQRIPVLRHDAPQAVAVRFE